MALVLPIDELLVRVSDPAPCGVADAATEAQLNAIDAAVKWASKSDKLHLLRQAAEGLFRGGQIPDLGDRTGEAKVEVQPVKHLQAAMALAMTVLEADGLPAFSDALVLIQRLLADQWDNVFPVANPDDPEGEVYIGRVIALNPLCFPDPAKVRPQPGAVADEDPWGIEGRLFKTPLLQSDRHGRLSLRDALSPWAKELHITLPPGEDRTADFIHEVRLAAGPALDSHRQALQAAVSAVQGIASAFQDKPGKLRPNVDYLARILKSALDVLEDAVEAAATNRGLLDGPHPVRTGNGDGGPVSSRDDAIRKLVEVAEYFRRHEPASPVPLLLDRVKRMAGMTFLGLLEELALGEQAVPEFRKLAGIHEPAETGEAAPPANPESSG